MLLVVLSSVININMCPADWRIMFINYCYQLICGVCERHLLHCHTHVFVICVLGSSGIGRATALALARCGAKVIAVTRTQADLDSLVQEVHKRFTSF